MNFEELFRNYLLSQQPTLQPNSVKNYLADIRKFISWFEHTHTTSFSPGVVNSYTIRAYKQSLTDSAYQSADTGAKSSASESIERYLSSLRKFFSYLQKSGYIHDNPLADIKAITDPYFLKSFRHYLLINKIADVSSKNYLVDVQLFLFWLRTTHQSINAKENDVTYISDALVEEYKNRLIEEHVSPSTINRRLSSLRKYAGFLRQEKIINNNPIATSNIPYSNLLIQSPPTPSQPNPTSRHLSLFPPLRLMQRSLDGVNFLLEMGVVIPLAHAVISGQYILWQLSGRQLFVPEKEISADFSTYLQTKLASTSWTRKGRIYSESFYAPLRSTPKEDTTLSKGIKRHTPMRKIAFITTAASFGCIIFFLGMYLYTIHNQASKGILGASTNQRLLTFQGTLLDAQHIPITQPTQVRFSLYNDNVATHGALLWQTVQTVTPHSDGSFQATLGATDSLPQTLFTDNPVLYMGTTIGTNPELQPREEIPTVSLSNDSQELNGMPVVNQPSGKQRNVILALDSSGNLQIGGSSSPTFEATDGTFTLSGTTTVIATNSLSNGNVVLAPDGTGVIDVQKALTNTTNSGSFANELGAVEVDDTLAIWATSSAQPALQIEQDSTGDLIDASNSGISKFSVNYVGAGTFADTLAVNGGSLTSTSTTFHLLDNGPLELDIGGNANTLHIGSNSGTLTINNPTTALSGNLAFNGSGAGILFSGNNNHIIQASQGALLINNATLNNATFNSESFNNPTFSNQVTLSSGTSLLPQGSNNLGSSSNQFSTLYVNSICNGSTCIDPASLQANMLWQNNTNTLSPVNSSANLALGQTAANFRLDVLDTQSATVAAMITNASQQATASVLGLKIGNPSNTGTNHFIDFLNSNGEIIGSIQENGNKGIQLKNSGIGDFAEYLPKDPSQTIPSGSLVCFTENGNVTTCNQQYSTIAGVVSASPTILAGKDNGNASIPVGLTGQLQVNVSTQNGTIQPGDPISASDIPGVAVKATSAGPIIGHALAAYSETNPYVISSILVLVQPSWNDPAVKITDTGSLSIKPLATSQVQNGQAFTLLAGVNPMSTLASYTTAIIANLQTGIIKTQELVVADSATFLGTIQANAIQVTHLSADNVVIAGVSLQDYVNNLIHQSTPTIASTQSASASNLAVNIISPLGTASAVLVKGNLTTTGDASISGQVASSSLQTTDATISGTLHAHKIIADEIEGLNATSSATYVTNVTNIYQDATPSATPSPDESPAISATASALSDNTSLENLASEPITPSLNDINLASYSALLSDIPNLTMTNLTVTQGFMSTGPTSLGDTSIAGQLSIDGRLTLTDNAINIVGADLQIQPLRQGGVDFLSGLFAINTNGDINAKGNAVFGKNVTVNGTLATNTLSPLSNSNLNIQLATNSGVLIKNASHSAVVAFNNQGDIQASGSGSFSQLIANGLNIVQSAQADISITETVATASAGTATIYRGQTERTIITPFAKAKSLIYITPTSDTNGLTPYIARQTDPAVNPGEPNSFTIQISSPAQQDMHLNWWIVN